MTEPQREKLARRSAYFTYRIYVAAETDEVVLAQCLFSLGRPHPSPRVNMFVAFHLLAGRHRLAAARSRSGSNTPLACYSLPSRRFATPPGKATERVRACLFTDGGIDCTESYGCSGCRRAPTPTGFVRVCCLQIEGLFVQNRLFSRERSALPYGDGAMLLFVDSGEKKNSIYRS